MDKERRRFFRIEDTIGLKTEIVADNEVEQRVKNFWDDQHQFSLRNEFNYELERHQADLKHIKNKMPEVGRYLELLQKQLDMLTEKIVDESDSFTAEHKQVNLSAQGISFYTDEAMHVGNTVEMNLKLLPGQQKIVVFSKVVENSKIDSKQGAYKVALDFEHIHDADREILAKHVHAKQMRALGAARFEQDSQ